MAGTSSVTRLELTDHSSVDAGPFSVTVMILRTDGRGPRQDTLRISGLKRGGVSGTTVENGLPSGSYSLPVEVRPDGDSKGRPRIYPDHPFAI